MIKLILILLLAVSPFVFVGLINRVKAVWAGRRGASVFQQYYDFMKLIGKGEVISKTTSFIFQLAPSLNVAAVLFALMIVPVPLLGSLINFSGDFVLFTYTLGLAKFFMVLAAMDTGSSFEGMGASREVTFSTITESAFFIVIGSLSLMTGKTSFAEIFTILNVSVGYTILVKVLLVISLFIMLLTEGSRVPIDDPNTHLELTMIHEVMILDYSGPDLGFMLYASALKMVVFAVLIANLLVPANLLLIPALATFAVVLVMVFMVVGVVESLIARSRMSHVPQFIFLMTAFSMIAFAVLIFFLRGGI
jgi:formate hydrogenlyase subunit 4